MFTSCSKSFNFVRDSTLREQYKYTAKSNILLIYYNADKKGDKVNVSMGVKNISGNYLKNLSLYFYIDGPYRLAKYIDLGNLKNRSVKYTNLQLNSDIDKIYVNYEYIPVDEDSFLLFDSEQSMDVYRSYKDSVTLFLP
ncbi:MAG: hypothetical protein SVN78_01800 [Deferribacterota bacterium]|nr:hypothetical protein [Deferribacterota bacterium]